MRPGIPLLLLLAGTGWLGAQTVSPDPDLMPLDALHVRVHSRILDADETVIWERISEKGTLSGRAVVIRLEGDGFRLRSLFTPFSQEGGRIQLAAQAEISLEREDRRSVQSNFQTLSCLLGETVLYYPLGRRQPGQAHHLLVMEVLITAALNPEPVQP